MRVIGALFQKYVQPKKFKMYKKDQKNFFFDFFFFYSKCGISFSFCEYG